MSEQSGAILVAEIGSLTTRVLLVDVVEGEYRLISHAEKPSSIEPPYQNAAIAILEAAAQITEMTGIRLIKDGQLLMPQTKERNGVSHVVVVTSASGTLSLSIAAIASDISARSALNACHSAYTNVLNTITLDDFARQQEQQPVTSESVVETTRGKKKAQKAPASSRRSQSWIERQVQSMLATEPDAIMIAGGLEGGAINPLIRLAHIVALTTLRTSVDSAGMQQQRSTTYPIIYAGNSQARKHIVPILEDRAQVLVVENVRPTLEQENLEPVMSELTRLYDEHILPKLAGFSVLQGLSETPIKTVGVSQGLMTRFISERYDLSVLSLDVGATNSTAFFASPGEYLPTILGNCGTGYGITTVLKESGLSNIRRWLPFSMKNKDLLHWILNKLLRPHVIPTTHEDLFIEHAIAREAMRLVMDTMTSKKHALYYDMVVAGGSVLTQAPPGLALLTILDALQYAAEDTVNTLNIHLDILGLLQGCGALASLDPDAAVTVFERDMLQNIPLATCVVALGEGRTGKVALQAELDTGKKGGKKKVKVRHGDIVRLPLVPGQRGQLTLRPTASVRIGRNAPGKVVKSDLAAISGSMLGIIIDARGRPLRLHEDSNRRRIQIWDWLVALDVVEGANPYVDAAALAASIPDDEPDDELLDLSDLADWPEPDAEPTDGKADGSPAPLPEPAAPLPEPAAPAPEPAAPLPEPAAPAPEPAVVETGSNGSEQGGGRISLSDIDLSQLEEESPQPSEPAAQTPPEPKPGSLDSDLASLRMTVSDAEPAPEKPEETGKKKPKKKSGGSGLFGKKGGKKK